jgi:hypothetical protein
MRARILKSAIAAGALALAFATTIAPATAVWRGGGGGFHGGGWGGGMHGWHGGGFNGGWHGGGWGGHGYGWRGHGWGWGPAIGLGVLGGYYAGSALSDGYGYGAYDYGYGYNGPYGYGYGECVVNEPLYNAWGVVVGHHAVYVC